MRSEEDGDERRDEVVDALDVAAARMADGPNIQNSLENLHKSCGGGQGEEGSFLCR